MGMKIVQLLKINRHNCNSLACLKHRGSNLRIAEIIKSLIFEDKIYDKLLLEHLMQLSRYPIKHISNKLNDNSIYNKAHSKDFTFL